MNLGNIYKDKHDNWCTPSDIYNYCINNLRLIDFNPLEVYHCNSFLKDYNNYFCNPPFSNIEPFVDYMIENNKKGFNSIMLLPVRLNTIWFYKLMDYGCDIMVLGRLKYNDKGFAPFDSFLVILHGSRENSKISFNEKFYKKTIKDISYKQLSIFDILDDNQSSL